jgi:hypothetical protein
VHALDLGVGADPCERPRLREHAAQDQRVDAGDVLARFALLLRGAIRGSTVRSRNRFRAAV